jgi:hypothetical protein
MEVSHLFSLQNTGHRVASSANSYNETSYEQFEARNKAVQGGMAPATPSPRKFLRPPHMVQPSLPQFVDSNGSLARPAPVEYDRMAYAASASTSTPTIKTPYDVYCEAVKASEAEHMGRMLAAYTEQRSRSSFQQWADWRAGVSDPESDSKGKRKSTL